MHVSRPLLPALGLLALAGAAAAAPAPASPQRVRLQPAVKPAGLRPSRGPTSLPLRNPDPPGLRRAKRAAERPGAPGGGSSFRGSRSGPGPRASVFGSLDQPGLAADDNSPPDTTGAIGPSHYLELVNHEVGVYSRGTLALASSSTLETFIGGTAVCDPQIQWDGPAGRWVYAALECGAAPASQRLYVGYSRTADPSNLATGWCKYQIPTSTTTADYPKLGHNDTHWVITSNDFDAVGNFAGVSARAVPKPPSGNIGACPATPSAFVYGPAAFGDDPDGDPWFTLMPANTLSATPNAIVVSAEDPQPNPGGTAARLGTWRFSGGNATTAPTLTNTGTVAVNPYGVPANVPQPGSSDEVDSSDARLTQAVAQNDPGAGGLALWTEHTIEAPGSTSAVRWYEVAATTSPTLLQQGDVTAESGLFAFNGAISPTTAGNSAVIHYNVGGAGQLVQLRARSRRPAMPRGAMRGETVLGTSAAIDADFTCPSNDPTTISCRWGDYAGASPDPADSGLAWGSGQLNGPIRPSENPSWVTRNFALAVDPNSPPAAGITGPSSAPAGRLVGFAAGISDADGGPVSAAWGLDGDGAFDDATGTTVNALFPRAGSVTLRVRATDEEGAATVASKPVTVTDVTAPRGSLRVGGHQRLRTVNRLGLGVRLRSSESARSRLLLLVGRRTARRLHLRGRSRRVAGKRFVIVGKLDTRFTKAGSKRLKVKLSRAARRRLAGLLRSPAFRRLRVTALATLTDSARNAASLRKTVTVRR